MPGLSSASYASLLGLLICALPTVVGVLFLFRPGERLLALMRPFTMAAMFSVGCGFALAVTNGLVTLSRVSGLDAAAIRHVAIVSVEGMVPVTLSLALLTVGWICVGLGMRNHPQPHS